MQSQMSAITHFQTHLGKLAAAAALAFAVAMLAATPAGASGPTCSDFGGGIWENHGQHIVGDYVVGGGVEWPPAGAGKSVGEQGGAAMPGASGIHQHGPEPGTFQPGASFCVENANSPVGQDLPRGHNQ